ncbi:MAG: hypothetical protein IH884_02780 [Myxococcales bacterium]|nr:hypothetical protein [Myxococcales bacterium]
MSTAPGTSSAAAPGRARWVQSPGWDAFWMFSGIWGCGLLLAGSIVSPIMWIPIALFALDRTVSIAHAWSTTYLVLFSPLLAEPRREDRTRFVWIPLGLVMACLALGWIVASTQRYGPDGRFTSDLWALGLYLGVFWIGHFWHFGNQDFGVLTIYRTKAGQTQPIDRKLDKAYTVTMMFLIQPVIYFSLITTTAISEMVYTLLPISKPFMQAAASVAVGASLIVSVAIVTWELRKKNRSIPKLLYILVIAFHPIILWGSVRAGSTLLGQMYIVSYLFSHWLIAVGLVERINTGFYRSEGDTSHRAILRHVAVIGAITGLVMLLTRPYGNFLLFNIDRFQYKQILASITPEQVPVIGLVLGFFLGEQLLHYYSDRRLFRFRHASVRRKVAPLLLGTP